MEPPRGVQSLASKAGGVRGPQPCRHPTTSLESGSRYQGSHLHLIYSPLLPSLQGDSSHALLDLLEWEVLPPLPRRFFPLTPPPDFSWELKIYLEVIIQCKIEMNLVAVVGHLDLTGHF